MIAIWIPNILYAFIAFFLYKGRPSKQNARISA